MAFATHVVLGLVQKGNLFSEFFKGWNVYLLDIIYPFLSMVVLLCFLWCIYLLKGSGTIDSKARLFMSTFDRV